MNTLLFQHINISILSHRLSLFFVLTFVLFMPKSYAQLIVAEGFSANVLVSNVLVADGIATRNVAYSGYDRSIALFENGDKADLGIDKGIILSSGVAVGAKGPNDDVGYTSGLGGPGNTILEKIAGKKTLDASVLTFEFKPQTDRIEFRYIFASDEYKEWVDAGFNDIFGFFISGPGITGEQNVALVPGSNVVVSIDNVNHKRNTAYYVDNNDVTRKTHKYLQSDGLTTVLVADLSLQACEWYTIKLAIADVGDPIKDSWVFIESKSFKHKTAIGADTTYCSGNFVHTLDAGNPGRQVLWSTGERTQKIQVAGYGIYTVEVFTDCGSFKDEINILPAISPIFIGNDTFACGNEIDITLEVKNRVFDKYLWSNGDTSASIQVTNPGIYWLTVERNGCTDTDSIIITDKTVPVFDLGVDTFICGDFKLLLNPGISADSFLWSTSSTASYLQIDEKGKYWLRLEKDGCNFSDTITIDNRGEFSFDLGPPKIELCELREITLDTKLRDTLAYEIRWSTGDTTPFLIVEEGGVFTVTVRDRNCPFEVTDNITIEMLGVAQNFFVPNAFSPNDDGLNESIAPIFGFSDVQDYKFVVFNKWGQKVFETEVPGERWNGKIDGNDADGGVYMWYCNIKTPCLPDPLQYQNGTITVIR
jgi:gliding motility-associated-like protein